MTRDKLEDLAVRPNWRDIPVVELRDCEVDLMTKQQSTWCLPLLVERARKVSA